MSCMRMVKRAVKRFAEYLPLSVAELMWRVVIARWETDSTRTARELYHKLGSPDRVMAGPFAGNFYIQCGGGGAWLPRLLGTYEKELWPVIESICKSPFSHIVDIGSAEGITPWGWRGDAITRRLCVSNRIRYVVTGSEDCQE